MLSYQYNAYSFHQAEDFQMQNHSSRSLGME